MERREDESQKREEGGKRMLIVLGEIVVDAAAVEGASGALRTMEEETRKEPGCISYAFSVDVNDSATLRVTELWESMDALEKHFGAPHMAEFRTAVVSVKPKSMDIKLDDVAGELAMPTG
jgi:quinol monooxygenase YgiN